MCLTEQKTERLNKLSKKDLMIMLEPYTDDSLICIGLQMQQGYVGFYDLEQDTKHKDKYEFVLNSDCFNEWYKKDITELKEKIDEQQATIDELEKNFDDLVKWASEIAKRNVLLDERIGRLQQEEKLYAQEILRLNTLLKQYQANQDLGGGY